LAKKVTKP